jgi:hypothetical protein
MAKSAPHYNLFKLIDLIRAWLTRIFVIVFLLSLVPAVLRYFDSNLQIDEILSTLNIIAIGLVFSLELLVEYILVPQADTARRDDFLDNSFGSKFSTNPSEGYYDNDSVSHGDFKVASNLFENCFFTYNLAKAITLSKVIWPTILMLTVAVCAYYGFDDVPFGLSVLQILFSMNILGDLIKHCILLSRLHDIQDAWIALFQSPDFKLEARAKYTAHIHRYWLQYEALHSRIQASIPEKIFNKLNADLTNEWQKMKDRYNIN